MHVSLSWASAVTVPGSNRDRANEGEGGRKKRRMWLDCLSGDTPPPRQSTIAHKGAPFKDKRTLSRNRASTRQSYAIMELCDTRKCSTGPMLRSTLWAARRLAFTGPGVVASVRFRRKPRRSELRDNRKPRGNEGAARRRYCCRGQLLRQGGRILAVVEVIRPGSIVAHLHGRCNPQGRLRRRCEKTTTNRCRVDWRMGRVHPLRRPATLPIAPCIIGTTRTVAPFRGRVTTSLAVGGAPPLYHQQRST